MRVLVFDFGRRGFDGDDFLRVEPAELSNEHRHAATTLVFGVGRSEVEVPRIVYRALQAAFLERNLEGVVTSVEVLRRNSLWQCGYRSWQQERK